MIFIHNSVMSGIKTPNDKNYQICFIFSYLHIRSNYKKLWGCEVVGLWGPLTASRPNSPKRYAPKTLCITFMILHCGIRCRYVYVY